MKVCVLPFAAKTVAFDPEKGSFGNVIINAGAFAIGLLSNKQRMMNRFLTTALCLVFSCSLSQAQVFTDVALNAGINHVFDYGDMLFGGGAAVFDYNNDGFEDVFITGGEAPDQLYKNNGDGSFTAIDMLIAGFNHDEWLTIGATAGDINNDGFRDLFITVRCADGYHNGFGPNLLYLNNGDETFTDISVSSGIADDTAFSTMASFGDYNKDGYLDIYVSNFLHIPAVNCIDTSTEELLIAVWPGTKNRFYINNGDNTFTEISEIMGVADTGMTVTGFFTDYDNDGDLDIYCGNILFCLGGNTTTVYRNNYPHNSFTEDIVNTGFHPFTFLTIGVAQGDYDGDGKIDMYLNDLGRNFLFKNNGNGYHTDVTFDAGVEHLMWFHGNDTILTRGGGTNFMDYDNDGDLDLFIANGSGRPHSGYNTSATYDEFPDAFFENNGNGQFTDIAANIGLQNPRRGRGSVTFDYDNDGDLDILLVNQKRYKQYGQATDNRVWLYQNNSSNSNNWFRVKLQGRDGNRDGIGSTVSIVAAGKRQIRLLESSSSHISHNSLIAHFGLASATHIDTLEIQWFNGYKQILTNLSANQQITVVEKVCSEASINVDNCTDDEIQISWNPIDGASEYEVRYIELLGTKWETIKTSAPTATLDSLPHCTPFEIDVTTHCDNSEQSEIKTIVAATNSAVCSQLCEPPKGLRVENATSTTAMLFWEPDIAATGWQISVKEFGSNAPSCNLIAAGSKFKKQLNGSNGPGCSLTPGTAYQVKLRKRCSTGESAYSYRTFITEN